MARPWYSFYPADYLKDTGHLALIEHGAYRVLMDHYYATGAPLPADLKRLMRLCRAKTRFEKAAVRFVLEHFFVADEDGFRHKRIDAEIEKAAEQVARLSQNGRLGVAARRGLALAEDTAGLKPSQSQSHSQSQSQSESPDDDGFAEFWTAYPRKESRGAAARAFVKARALTDAATLVAAARAYAARRDGQDGKFTRLPATWLSQECWLDDVGLVVDEGAMAALWDGRAAPLVAEIGAAAFKAYFAGADFSTGPPAVIAVATPHLAALIARKFSAALGRALGEYSLEVRA